jgi:hypothetical protein
MSKIEKIYKDKTGPFEGVREVGRAVKKAATTVAKKLTPAPAPKKNQPNEIHKVKGPFKRSK